MKIKAIIVILVLMLTGSMQAIASQLPQDLKNFLINQKRMPTIRHDGVVIYNDIMYIPVFPAYPEKVDEIKIVQTYPANQKMYMLPDIVIFNNNFALLKVLRTGATTQTVRNLDKYPVVIKTGEIPQDLMVPTGLVLPEALAGIIGDVKIPLIGSAKSNMFITGKKAPLPSGGKIADTKHYNVPDKLKNKLFFVNNFQTEYLKVFSSSVPEPLYSLKTSGVMKDVKPIVNGKYLLAATKDAKNLDVIDTEGEFIFKHIDLTANPSEIAVDDAHNKAYVSSIEDESLFVIDTNSFKVVEKIQLAGAPKRLSVSPDGNKIAYMDIRTSNVFILELNNSYSNKLITNFPNTSKILLDNDTLYLIARTEPKLRVVSFNLLMDDKVAKTKKDKKAEKIEQKEMEETANDNVGSDLFTGMDVPDKDEITGLKMYATSIKDVQIGAKPVDLYKYDHDIFVLCAGNNTVYKYNLPTSEVISTELPTKGFARTFTHIPNSNIAVITNMADFKYVVYDMEQAKATNMVPINDYINEIVILDRKNGK